MTLARAKASDYLSITPRAACFSPWGTLIASLRVGLLPCALDPGYSVWSEEICLGVLCFWSQRLAYICDAPSWVPWREVKVPQGQPQDQPVSNQKLSPP